MMMIIINTIITMQHITNIKFRTQPLKYKNEEKLNCKLIDFYKYGFMIKYKKFFHLITIHDFLPINKIFSDDYKININIKINSGWSPILILKTDFFDLDKFHIFKDFQNALPKPNDKLTFYRERHFARYRKKFVTVFHDVIINLVRISECRFIYTCITCHQGLLSYF